MLSGHGCFGAYLRRIGREPTAACWFCEEDMDDAQHTLQHCPAWSAQRADLRSEGGVNDLALPGLLREMIRSDQCWRAVVHFCEAVITRKEEVERERREENPPPRPGGQAQAIGDPPGPRPPRARNRHL